MGVDGDKLNLIPVRPDLAHSQKKSYEVDGNPEQMAWTGLGHDAADSVNFFTTLFDTYDEAGNNTKGNISGGESAWYTFGHDSLYAYAPEGSTNKLNLVFEDWQTFNGTHGNGILAEIDENTGSLTLKIREENLDSWYDTRTSGDETGHIITDLSEVENTETVVDTSDGLDKELEGGIKERDVLKTLIKLGAKDIAYAEDYAGNDANFNPEVAKSAKNFLANYAKVLIRDGHYDKFKDFMGVMKDAIGYGKSAKIISGDSAGLVDLSKDILNSNSASGDKPARLSKLRELSTFFKGMGAGNSEVGNLIDDQLEEILGRKSDQKEAREEFKKDVLRGDKDDSAVNTLLEATGHKKPPAPSSSTTKSPATSTGTPAPVVTPPVASTTKPAEADPATSAPAATTPAPDPVAAGIALSAKITTIQSKLADPNTDPAYITEIDEAFRILNSDDAIPTGNKSIATLIDSFKDEAAGTNAVKDSLAGKTPEQRKAQLKSLVNQVNEKYVSENGPYKTENFDPSMAPRELASGSKGIVDFVQSQFINNPSIQRNQAQQQALMADMERFMTGGQIEGELAKHFNAETANPDPAIFSDANPDLVQGMWDSSQSENGFNINAIFDGKTTVSELAEKLVAYNEQYGLPAELVDRSSEESRVGITTDPTQIAPLLNYLGLNSVQYQQNASGQVVAVDTPITFRMENREVKASSIPESYDKFLRATYPDKEPFEVLGDNSLVDSAGNLDKNGFYKMVMDDISKMKSPELTVLKEKFDEMGLKSVLSEKKFYKAYTAKQYEASILRYLQQLDSYRVHFQDNISPLKEGIDPVVLGSFGDFYPQYKPESEE